MGVSRVGQCLSLEPRNAERSPQSPPKARKPQRPLNPANPKKSSPSLSTEAWASRVGEGLGRSRGFRSIGLQNGQTSAWGSSRCTDRPPEPSPAKPCQALPSPAKPCQAASSTGRCTDTSFLRLMPAGSKKIFGNTIATIPKMERALLTLMAKVAYAPRPAVRACQG